MPVAPVPLTPSDEELFEAIRKGSHPAFAQLVRRHSTRFYNLAYRFTNNRQDAEDMVQNAFLKLWDNPNIWQAGKGARFTTWFYRVIVNQCLDEKRRRKPVAIEEGQEFASTEAPIEDRLDEAEQNRRVEAALKTLREKDRTALNLCFYHDLPRQEAADIMGMTLKAFESVLFRAKAALREKVLTAVPQKENAYARR